MKALLYLARTNLKNFFVRLKKKPGQLILYLIFFVVLCLVFFSSTLETNEPVSVYRPVGELYAIVFGFYMFGLYTGIFKGLSTGGSFFTMADANLLFTAPISPKRILLYGLLRQAATTLLMGVFLLFQVGTIRSIYNQDVGVLLAILVGFVLNQLCGELVAVVVYSVSSGNDARRKRIKYCTWATLLPLLIGIVLRCGVQGEGMNGLVGVMNGRAAELYPFAGWLKGACASLMGGDLLLFFVYLGAVALVFAGLLFFLRRYNVDYYEDVLRATEQLAVKQQSVREGNLDGAPKKPLRRGAASKGLTHGRGASVLFYKHMLENKRSGLLLFDSMTLAQFVSVGVFALIMRGSLQEEGPAVLMVSVFAFSVYFQLFTTSAGRWVKEMLKQYIFLIPARPFRKLVYACMENVLKGAAEGVVLFLALGLLLGAGPGTILTCIVARVSYTLLFISGNVLMERLFQGATNRGLILMMYFIIMLVLAVPGVLVGIFACLGLTGGLSLAGALCGAIPVNIAIAAAIFALCRNILHNTDITVVQQ